MDPSSTIPQDANDARVMAGIDSTDPTKVLPLEVNPATGGLIVDATIDTSGLATEAKQDNVITELQGINSALDGTIAVSAASLPLPSGAATAANQQTDALTNTELRATPVVVDLGANNDVTVAALPLPSGAATSALQTTGNGILTTIDADTSILAGAVSGSEMQVDVVGALPAGSNNIGKVVITDGTDDAAVVDSSGSPGTKGIVVLNPDGSNIGGGGGGGSVTEFNEDTAHSSGASGVFMLGVRQDANTTPVSADGDYHGFIFNDEGRLKVSTQPGAIAATTGDISAVAGTVVADVTRASNVMMHVTGTFAGMNCTFEGSIDGGTTWFAIQAVRSNANTIELTTGALSAVPAYGWELSVNAMTHVRVRCTARTSGTQSWRILPGSYATEPIPAIQTHAVTGSGNFATTMAANATTTPAKARDAVAGASDTGIPALTIKRATPTAVSAAAGDYEPLQSSSNGELWVKHNDTLTVDGSGVTQPVSAASLPLPSGAATAANQTTIIGHVDGLEGLLTTIDADTSALAGAISNSAVNTREAGNTTATLSNVSGATSSTTVLASNANRKGATIYNDSGSTLYLKLGSSASSTSFTTKMLTDDYYEVPANYTGIITGIWDTATGAARVTEIT